MPIFEFRCSQCHRRFSDLVGVVANNSEPTVCPHCGSADVVRIVSRFARLRSEDDMMEQMLDPSKLGDIDDPKNLARVAKEMGKEMGEDFSDEIDAALEQEMNGGSDGEDGGSPASPSDAIGGSDF